jgi:hypothetical protein
MKKIKYICTQLYKSSSSLFCLDWTLLVGHLIFDWFELLPEEPGGGLNDGSNFLLNC